MNSIFFYKFINLTLLAILGNLRQTPTVALALGNQISLYNAGDKVTILTSQNFSSTVYNSSTAWLIEFYASWCGHCQYYANV
jgi:thioredoxin-like negative regulator of GroEL